MGELGEKSVVTETVTPARPTPSSRARGQPEGPERALAGRSRAKRAFDLVVTVCTMPLVVPLSLLIALVVAVTSRGPVLFFQERVGIGGNVFRMVKFRTMHVDAEARLKSDPELWATYRRNDYKLPAEVDSRVTGVGRFLRRSSLDELPQLLNVLRGDMTLVGPRPIVPDEIEMYGGEKDIYLSVRPGITGTWQVNGRSGVGYPERITYDREYVEHWNFWLDVKVLLRTPLAVLTSRGAH